MHNKVILHVPHSSPVIPSFEGFVVDTHSLTNEVLKLTDWCTDDLFYSEEDEMIKAEFSRVFCDPERFTNDSEEVMYQYGMGVLYELCDDGQFMREVTPELKEKLLNGYYQKHHSNLNTAVNQQLSINGKALIIDCHSYPSIPMKRDLDKQPNRPDFNIGTDSYHTPQHLIDLSIAYFKNAGYTLGVNYPYKGALVPMEHYKKNNQVQSIMLEINRALYLNEPSNIRSDNYNVIKKVTANFIKTIKATL